MTEICKIGWRSLAVALAVGCGGMGGMHRATAAGGGPPCLECVEIRLERPVVVRGPSPHEPDAPVSVIKLPDGRYRGFIAGGTTLAVDGPAPTALGGQGRVALGPGPPGSPSDCGRWITTVMQGFGILYGLVHDETRCNDPKGSYKSMSIARSADDGLTWEVRGPIITSDEGNVARPEGEGDCTAADGHDGYWYAYCLRRRDGKNTVARAPIENPAPGKWMKWSGHDWKVPAVGGTGAPLPGFVGMSSAYWSDADLMLLLGTTSSMYLSISEDKVHFATIADPIILYDEYNWNRPAPTELYAYPSLIAAGRGFNDIARRFFLAYMYVPPNEDFSRRYLVMQEGEIGASALPRSPQVRTALSRWTGPDGATWTTTGPTISPRGPYSYDRGLGYLMTAPPREASGVKLDECFSPATGNGFLAEAGQCAAKGSERRRPAGYALSFEQPGTLALYACVTGNGAHFVSDRADCENKSSRGQLLGFALR